MQRKNHILKRGGFAMIMAIILVIVLTTIVAFMLGVTHKTSVQTNNLYLQEQAKLLAKSGAEYALLAVSGYERNATTGCLKQVNAVYPSDTNPLFDINVTMHYIGVDCYNNAATATYIPLSEVHTPASEGSVLMDVTVTSTPGTALQTIRYTRRTLQKL
jgi:type II secretory pathway component PulK